jgi:hypothetical protein
MKKIKASELGITFKIDDAKYVVAIRAEAIEDDKRLYYVCLKNEIENSNSHIQTYHTDTDNDELKIMKSEGTIYEEHIIKSIILEEEQLELILKTEIRPRYINELTPGYRLAKADLIIVENEIKV